MNYFQKGMVLMAMVLLGGCMPKRKSTYPERRRDCDMEIYRSAHHQS